MHRSSSLSPHLRPRHGYVLTTDVSELRRRDAASLPADFYREFAQSRQLGILITDFPLRVKGVE